MYEIINNVRTTKLIDFDKQNYATAKSSITLQTLLELINDDLLH